MRALLVGGVSSPISSSARSGRKRIDRALGQLAAHLGRRRPSVAPASSTISLVARSAAGSARYGSTPFSQRFEPSVRRREALGAPEDRRAARSSRPRAGRSVVASPTSVSSPPMIPASATGVRASAITRSAGSSLRSSPSSVRIFSPGARAADDDAALVELGRGRTRAAGCRARASRSWSRRRRSRSGACRRATRRAFSQTRRRADRDVPEEPADVARAALEILDLDRRPARRRDWPRV